MCGIAGYSVQRDTSPAGIHVLEQMGDAIAHRGPDGSGHYIDTGTGLCHRRLAVIDLSESGKQPMVSRNGRFVIVFNGEIYNFQTLKNELESEGVRFRGTSDTEVLLALYEREGRDCLQRLNGMFAFAIWDTIHKRLFLARDRLGKKPLYYYDRNGVFVFASELKALTRYPNLDLTLDDSAVKDFFHYQYIPDPKSIYRHVRKLPPAHWLDVRCDGSRRLERYWSVSFEQIETRSTAHLEEELLSLIDDSVRCRMISDVPLGAFLSGGIDSSMVVALMAKASPTPVTTCSIGFAAAEYDELEEAGQLSSALGTDHHAFRLQHDLSHTLTSVATRFDEPFADASFLPTFHVSRLARQRVTVALSGDGGDENFAGYNKYLTDQTESRMRALAPGMLWALLGNSLTNVLERSGRRTALRGASLLTALAASPAQAFFNTNSFFRRTSWAAICRDDFATATRAHDPSQMTRRLYAAADTDNHLSRLLYVDLHSYLPGDILVKVDRMSMANSLETRAPLLDYRLVEFAARLPAGLKLNGRQTKYLLKRTAGQVLSSDILSRRKRGFSVPLDQWLKNELRETVTAHFNHPHAGVGHYFDLHRVKAMWNEHLDGRRDHTDELFSLLMFEIWWQQYIERKAIAA